MPLLKISFDFRNDIETETRQIQEAKKNCLLPLDHPEPRQMVQDLFEKMEYLGSNWNDPSKSYEIFLVEAANFEPGEYFLEILACIKIVDNVKTHSFQLKRA